MRWRGIATRYDKYTVTYLGDVILAATIIHSEAVGDMLYTTLSAAAP